MRKIVIRNIGPQSSGKSCVLKIACYCTWVEKKIELAQSADTFMKDGSFIHELTRFHKLNGYFREDSFIGYESEFMRFSYESKTDRFSFAWKEGRWEYKRPKVSYIPAERNMVAAIPNWFDVKLYDDNIQSFMADWDRARKNINDQQNILNLGVTYRYDAQANKDKVKVDVDTTLELTNTSSGLQSLIPLYVHLDYVGNLYKNQEKGQSYSEIQLGESFLKTMYMELFEKKGKTEATQLGTKINEQGKRQISASFTIASIGPYLLHFANSEYADECRRIFERYVNTNHAEIFLEEPENNLFPPTQVRLVDWLLKFSEGEHASNVFVATHSPYMMTAFLEQDLKNFRLFFVKKEGNKSVVVTATEDDVQEIYDDGIDVFYNIESYT